MEKEYRRTSPIDIWKVVSESVVVVVVVVVVQ